MAGFRQFEWLVRAKLQVGLQAFRDDPTLVDTLFADLSANSRANVKDYLANHDVAIQLGYPQETEDLPMWCIALAGEATQTTPIGAALEHTFDLVAGETSTQGDVVRKTYQIFTISLNPDLTVILSSILQQILKSMRQDMALDGFYDMAVGQQDPLNLRVDFLPSRLYVRTTTLSFLTEDSVLVVDTTLPRALEISLSVDLSF